MSEQPHIERALEIDPARITDRLRKIEAQLGTVSDEIAANQREYEELIERNHILVSEHDALRRRIEFGGVPA